MGDFHLPAFHSATVSTTKVSSWQQVPLRWFVDPMPGKLRTRCNAQEIQCQASC